ncbi:TonB-dependent receptor [Glaciecola sp. MH2013]|uniref:TonB-dependent receptor n=1 Tax=Glaciecola sp. MH2013 TaxID=2785524 RepID=UPI00189DCE51|nr:TonB-dependent receptor [Glaciecola sp. MH2013]MBF7073668.1 TonB-dependent receptor [Glaciecola sp. MH2013]
MHTPYTSGKSPSTYKKSKHLLALAVSSALSIGQLSAAHAAATQESDDDGVIEIIEVKGIADSFRNAIAEKKNATTIVDALSSADLGTLPDLSVAETLERITGVTGDRFKGNASEISIRGLGPFLGFSTVNGRPISSGSGNRSVAFSQFPSELVNGVVVYKAQQADLLEGGVSGLIDLKTIKPVDYGKERFQAELRGNYNDYHAKFDDENGWGYRSSVSYTNTYELDELGEIGIAIGYAGVDSSTPEESYNTSSTLRNCNSNFALDGGSNCSFSDARAAANGGAAEDGAYYFIPNSFFYRQMKSEEDRDAALLALQWRPTADLDINLDGQWSNRFYFEDRHDLLWDDGRRRISNWSINDEGALQSYTGESRISSYGEYRVREEEYQGLGLNLDWQATDRLHLNFDSAFSGTNRYQTRTWARFRGQRKFYDWENSDGQLFPTVTNVYSDFNDPIGSAEDWTADIQDMSYFNADSEIRNYRFEIDDRISSYRLDAEYALDNNLIYNLRSGISISNHRHQNYQEERERLSTPSAERPEALQTVIDNCLIDFPQDEYGDDGKPGFSSWATFNTQCAYDSLIGDNDLSVDPKAPSTGDINLTEEIASFYLMADFSSEIGDVTVDGNFGIRHVETDITSVGIRTAFNVETDGAGFISIVTDPDVIDFNTLENSYSNNLLSLNIALGLTDESQLRFAIYEGLSRPDMWYYGAARSVSAVDVDDEFTTVEEALSGNVTALGNPFLEALESDNYDVSYSYFLNEDTMFSAALYYKQFNASFEVDSGVEQVIVDGQSYDVLVNGRVSIVDNESEINGYELTAVHQFAFLEGLGISLNYNFANSDFETPEAGGNISDEVLEQIEPANINGLSKHNFSSQVYWENSDISARISYKYRSEYLKPFGPNLAQTNRIVDDTERVDFDFQYKITKNLRAKFQVLNVTNEPYVEQRVAAEAYNRIEYSGRRFFVGFKYKL